MVMVLVALCTLVIFMGYFACLEAIPELPPLSCANSQIPSFIDVGSDFCSFINYKAARMYPKSEFTYHNPGNPITTDIQQSSAILFYRDLFRDISNNSKSLEVSQRCLDVMSDFACLQAFPACPLEDLGSSSMQSVTYLTPCKVHCKLIDYYCIRPLKNQKLINPYYLSHWYHCENYPTENCALHLNDDYYFALSPSFGPYLEGLEVVYSVFLVIWFGVAWVVNHYGLAKERIKKTESFAAFLVPMTKLLSIIFTLSFWSTCLSSVCHRWLSNALINTHLIYETAKFFYYMLVAKGWIASRNMVSSEDMRAIMTISVVFFVVATVIVSISKNHSGPFPAIAVVLLYAQVYGYILVHTHRTLRKIDEGASSIVAATRNMREDQVDENGVNIGHAVKAPLLFKQRLYHSYLLLLLVAVVCEVFYHLMQFDGVIWVVLLTVYEVLDLIMNCAMLFLFRSRSLSPFFFLSVFREQEQATEDEGGGVNTFDVLDNPEVMVEDDDFLGSNVEAEVETAPLIENQSRRGRGVEMVPAKLIVVRNPDALKLAIKHI